MKVMLYSDSHFSHFNIIKYCNRPFSSIEEMNSYMVSKWNSVVGPSDLVMHLGDFAMVNEANREEIINLAKNLNGMKILLRGNHDKKYSYKYFNACGFDCIFNNSFSIGDKLFSHRPIKQDQISSINSGKIINYHGHIHSNGYPNDIDFNIGIEYINCSVEVIDYTPFSIDITIDSIMQEVYYINKDSFNKLKGKLDGI